MSWKKVKLKDICTLFSDGDWIETKDQSAEGVRLVQTGNVKTGRFLNRIDKARYITETTFERLNCTEVREGDILVSRLPEPVGRACIIPKLKEKAITAVDCTVIRTNEQVLPIFLNYYMQSPQYFNQIQDRVTGATRQRISRKNLGEILITLPPLAEQQRIVAKLDAAFAEIDRAIELTKAKEAEANKLNQLSINTIINDVSSDEVVSSLEDIAKFLDYRGKTPEKSEKGIKLLTAKNIRMGFIKNDPEEFVSEKTYNSHMTRGFPRVGDVVFTTEAPLGLVAQIEDDTVALGQRLITFQVRNKIIKNEYLKYKLMSHENQNKIHAVGTGATVKGIKASLLKKIMISYPASLNTQVTRIEKIKKIEYNTLKFVEITKKKYASLKALKSAILTQELRPPKSEAA